MDYEKVGLKCGLEIHQQLESNKLFCNCPSLLREDAPDFFVKRELRAVAGERGEVDVAAEYEQLKGRHFVYEGYNDTTCLVELDEEPPKMLNKEALKVALEAAMLLKAKVVDVIQVMRKTVVDGSNTAGFQRTALVARNGVVDTKEGNVGVVGVCLEEDSARIIKENSGEVAYRLDRLGIPLIEIGTDASIKSPMQCLEVAEKLGMILRSTGKVKRGLGTIRQDVNVSVAKGARVEIKGAQELKLLPKLVENEVVRQIKLLEIMQELNKKNIKLKFEVKELSGVFKDSNVKIAVNAIKNKGVVLGLALPGFKGILGKEVGGKRFGTELSERAKVIANVGGIIHSDEYDRNNPGKYGLDVGVCCAVEDSLGVNLHEDAYVIVADAKEKAVKALKAVFERVKEALKGVTSEVRKANEDGTTSYLRPMPGAARMYPETDIPLIVPDVSEVKLSELIEKKVERYVKGYGLTVELAENIAKSDKAELFEELVLLHREIKASYIAEVLVGKITELKRDYNVDVSKINDDELRKVFKLLNEGKIHKDVMLDVLIDIAKGKFSLDYYESLGTEELHAELVKIIKENPGAPFAALMGIAVKRLKGKASGRIISEMLSELLQGHGGMKEERKVR